MRVMKTTLTLCLILVMATTAFAQDFEPQYIGGYTSPIWYTP